MGGLVKDGFYKQVDHKVGDDKYALLGAGGHKEWSTSNSENTLVARDANKDIFARLFNTSEFEMETTTAFSRVYVSNDSNIRWKSKANFAHELRDSGELDSRWVLKSGDIMTGALTIKGITDSGTYSQGGFNKAYANIILQGDNTYGVSGIVFKSMKGDNTGINNPSDVAFIQYHPYGVTASEYNVTPTEASSGERSRLVIGIGNDADNGTTDYGEELWLQTAGANDLKHYVVNTGYTILDTGNVSPSLPINGNQIAVTVGGVTSTYITVPFSTKADKLATARNLKVNLASSNTQSFDGSADATNIGVYGILPFSNLPKLYIGTTQVQSAETGGQHITGTGNITPYTNNTYNLGSIDTSDLSKSLFWKSTYTRIINSALTNGTNTNASNNSASPNRYKPMKWTFNANITPVNGDIITIKTPGGGHDYGVFLSTNNGTNYYPITLSGTGRMTTHFPTGTYLTLLFDSSNSASSMFALNGSDSRVTISNGTWRVINYYDSGNPGDWNLRQYNIKAAATINNTHIIGGTDSGYKNIDAGNAFDIRYPVLWAGSDIASGNAGSNNYIHHYAVNFRNSSNNNISGLTVYKNVYIKGTISGTIFTPISGGNPYVQDIATDITSTSDGKDYVYYYIGRTYDSAAITFDGTGKDIYVYKNGSIQRLDGFSELTNLLSPISSTTSVSRSTWNIPSECKQVWGEKFSDSTLKYVPQGSSNPTTITDTGDWVIWLSPSATNNVATLNMRIDGTFYGTFAGNLTGDVTGNADTATKLKNARNLKVNLASSNAQSFDGSADATNIGVAGTLPFANLPTMKWADQSVSSSANNETTPRFLRIGLGTAVDNSYSIKAVGTILSTSSPGFANDVTNSWAYMRFKAIQDTITSEWHIGTQSSTAGILGQAGAFEIRDTLSSYTGIAIRKGTSSYGKLVVTTVSGEVSIGLWSKITNQKLPQWTFGLIDTTNNRFGWYYVGNNTTSGNWVANISSTGQLYLGDGNTGATEKLDVNGNVRIRGNNEYLGTGTGSQCHMQYDNTNKCLNFIFD